MVRQRRIEIRRDGHPPGQETEAALFAPGRDKRPQLGNWGAGLGNDDFFAGRSFFHQAREVGLGGVNVDRRHRDAPFSWTKLSPVQGERQELDRPGIGPARSIANAIGGPIARERVIAWPTGRGAQLSARI